MKESGVANDGSRNEEERREKAVKEDNRDPTVDQPGSIGKEI